MSSTQPHRGYFLNLVAFLIAFKVLTTVALAFLTLVALTISIFL